MRGFSASRLDSGHSNSVKSPRQYNRSKKIEVNVLSVTDKAGKDNLDLNDVVSIHKKGRTMNSETPINRA